MHCVLTASGSSQYDRLKAHQRRLEQDYYVAARAARQALYDLDMAKVELLSSSAKRELSVKQLKLALDGKAGIDYDHRVLDDDE